MRPLYLAASFAALTLSACRPHDGHITCPANASVPSLQFRLLDATTKQDLFLSTGANKLSIDSVTGRQPCFPGSKQSISYNLYTIPNTPTKGYVFSFTNLRNPNLSETDSCFTIQVKWSRTDSGVINWHYHTQQVGDCTEQVIDFVSLNNVASVKVDDGMYTYWELRK